MADNQSEMSIDEVLSSIKKMVIDKEPPVLELTDMVSPDGSIVKVRRGIGDSSKRQDMSTFLQLVQESKEIGESESSKTVEAEKNKSRASGGRDDEVSARISTNIVADAPPQVAATSVDVSANKPNADGVGSASKVATISGTSGAVLEQIIREVAVPIVRDWLDANLPSIVRGIVTDEVRKLITGGKA